MPEVENSSTSIQLEPSAFSSHKFKFEINETKYSVRILKMNRSSLIYLGTEGQEHLDEIGIAMPVADSPSNVVSTIALGPQLGCESEQLAQKLAKRLHKQIYMSCNVNLSRMVIPLLEKKLIQIIKENPDAI